MKTSVEKLAERLKKDLDIDIDPKSFKRVYAGWSQRSRGAWSWFASETGKAKYCVGSQYPVSRLLKAKAITEYNFLGDTSIDPID